MKMQALRDMSNETLVQTLVETSQTLCQHRLQRGVGEAAKPHTMRALKRLVARIKTELTAREQRNDG